MRRNAPYSTSEDSLQIPDLRLPSIIRSLSFRLLILIVLAAVVGGLLIQVPSIARHRAAYLEHRLTDAYMATLAIYMDPAYRLDETLEYTLLEHVDALGIAVRHHHHDQATLALGDLQGAAASFACCNSSLIELIREAASTLWVGGDRIIQITGTSVHEADAWVTIRMNERPLFNELIAYIRQALNYVLWILLLTVALVYLGLRWLVVYPVRHMTASLIDFRRHPEKTAQSVISSGRQDEIGILGQELTRMQGEIRTALAQQSRLAALGQAVSKIHHDLQSILSTVSIASERLMRVDDTTVRKIAPLLMDSIKRAVHLCAQTQDLARGEQVVPQKNHFALHALINEVGEALRLNSATNVRWFNEVPKEFYVQADRERLYRVFLNLGRNALAVQDESGEIRIKATEDEQTITIDVVDTGPGIPADIREQLFQPFVGSARTGGTGLGLATARDLIRAHGGDLVLLETGPRGSCFRITLPKTDSKMQ